MGKSNKEEGIKVDEEDEVKGKLVILGKKKTRVSQMGWINSQINNLLSKTNLNSQINNVLSKTNLNKDSKLQTKGPKQVR